MINTEQLESDIADVMRRHGIGHVVVLYGTMPGRLAMFGCGVPGPDKAAADAIQDAIKRMRPDLPTYVEDAMIDGGYAVGDV